jgi:hypothetical protein
MKVITFFWIILPVVTYAQHIPEWSDCTCGILKSRLRYDPLPERHRSCVLPFFSRKLWGGLWEFIIPPAIVMVEGLPFSVAFYGLGQSLAPATHAPLR